MKYSVSSIVALAVTVGFASAQVSIANIPTCALSCLLTAIATTSCDVADNACQCESANRSAIQASATPCVEKACTAADAATTLQVTGEICDQLAAGSGSSSVASSATVATTATAAPTTVASSSPVVGSSSPIVESSASSTLSVVASTPAASTGPVVSTPVASTTVASAPFASTPAVSVPVGTATSGVAGPTGGAPAPTTSVGFTGAAAAHQAAATMGSVFVAIAAVVGML